MGSANVQLETLNDFKVGLHRYKNDMQAALMQAEHEIVITKRWLQERNTFWEKEMRRCQQRLQIAEDELKHCAQVNAGRGRRSYHDCTSMQLAVARVRHQLMEAERHFKAVREASRDFEAAVISFQQKVRQMQHLLEEDYYKAIGLLENSLRILQAYIAD